MCSAPAFHQTLDIDHVSESEYRGGWIGLRASDRVTKRWVQAISRKDPEQSGNPQRLYARPVDDDGMRKSDLHGDMQSQTETIWPQRDPLE